MTLNEIAKLSYKNALQRQQNGANITTETRKMLKHCATEVVEAMEAYSLCTVELVNNNQRVLLSDCKSFISELADIICCVTIIAGKENIDLDKAVLDCLEKNRKRAEGTGDKK